MGNSHPRPYFPIFQTLTLTTSPSRGWKRGRGTGGQRRRPAKKGGGRTPTPLHNDFDNKKSMLGMHFPLHTFTTNVTKGEQKMAMKLVLGDEWSVTPFYTCSFTLTRSIGSFPWLPLLLWKNNRKTSTSSALCLSKNCGLKVETFSQITVGKNIRFKNLILHIVWILLKMSHLKFSISQRFKIFW